MTRLLNLESYIECCQYAQLFNEPVDTLIPSPVDLPRSYKQFLQKYANYPYIQEPIIDVIRPQELTINRNPVDYLSIGKQLTQTEKQRLLIIPDTVDLMTLSMSNLLEHGDSYLYSSAYHYWNNYSQICKHQFSQPFLVFVCLDNFASLSLIPVNFSRPNNSHYQVPTLEIKKPLILDSAYNFIETHQSIYESLAYRIIEDNFPELSENIETVNHLTKYLQKISLFQILQPYINQEAVSLIIEILYNQQIFYKKVTLSIDAIANIISSKINIQYLRQLANKYPQYQFALITQYNIFAHIQELLPEFICLNPISQQFNQIWQEKIEYNFPLFGIYLDQIQFAIGIADNNGGVAEEWIQLSNLDNAISYEGEPTVLTGRIPSLNQDFFRISQGRTTANLPIKVNGEDYCKNGVPQDYKIEIKDYEGTEDVRIRIEFHLQPGSFPELRVTDVDGKYNNISAFLTERIKLSYSYIPPEKINTTRQQESLNQIERLTKHHDLQEFKTYLQQISQQLPFSTNIKNCPIKYQSLTTLIKTAVDKIKKNNNRPDLLKFIDASSNEVVVNELKTELQNLRLNNIVDIIYGLLNSQYSHELSTDQKFFLVDATIFIGKLYQFSQYLLADKLFSHAQFTTASQIRYSNLDKEYLQCLARIAVNQELQQQYFSYFDSNYNLENSQYLWGYGRILLWYYNFDSANTSLNYSKHLRLIMEYLLTKPYPDFEYMYKQDAFLSLLYLLSFRAHDRVFCQDGSREKQLAERVIVHFRNDRIILNEVSSEKPLNQFFQEMIEGTATERDVKDLLHC